MKKVIRVAISMLLTFTFVAAGGAMMRSQAQTQSSATSADNTKMNADHDRDSTADQQKENRSDRDITQQIRQSIVSDKSLSSYAHNVKIITQNGAVTLKGPVRSDEEKRAIEAKATEIAGENKVTSNLNIKPKQ